jgi:hypothetical protein
VERSLRTRTIVPFDLSDPAVMPRLHRLLDRVWEGHVGYTHLDLDEFVECYGGILQINPPKYLGVITSEKGEDLALGLSYPDYAAEVRALNGDASGWASWVGKTPLPRQLVMHTMAAVPGERGGGSAILIVDHAGRCLQEDGFEGAIVALVTEELKLFDRFAEPTREYALYRRETLQA